MVKTSIQVEDTTRSALFERGRKGQSYDDIIKELLEVTKEGTKKKRGVGGHYSLTATTQDQSQHPNMMRSTGTHDTDEFKRYGIGILTPTARLGEPLTITV